MWRRLTTCAFWPQLRKTRTTKSVGDLSLGMLAIFSTGVGLRFLCEIALAAWPIILMNAVTLLLTGAILARKLRFQPCPVSIIAGAVNPLRRQEANLSTGRPWTAKGLSCVLRGSLCRGDDCRYTDVEGWVPPVVE